MGSSGKRTIVVTGAGSGIGQAAVLRFLAEGATVYGADLDTEGVPDGAFGIACDVSEPTAVRNLVETALAGTGRIDVLCNNAGIGSTADPLTCEVEEWDKLFAVNVRSVFLGTKYALPTMLSRRSGVIVNTASVAGMVGLRDRAAYCATKGAVIAFTRQVAVQYAADGIRCNCVCPGTVDSPWVGRLLDQALDATSARASLAARQPIGRLAQPDEIAAAIVYLSSSDAAFVTGSAFVIDGGLTAV